MAQRKLARVTIQLYLFNYLTHVHLSISITLLIDQETVDGHGCLGLNIKGVTTVFILAWLFLSREHSEDQLLA